MVYNVPKDAVSAHGDIQMSLSLLAFIFGLFFSIWHWVFLYGASDEERPWVVLKSDQLTQGEK